MRRTLSAGSSPASVHDCPPVICTNPPPSCRVQRLRRYAAISQVCTALSSGVLVQMDGRAIMYTCW